MAYFFTSNWYVILICVFVVLTLIFAIYRAVRISRMRRKLQATVIAGIQQRMQPMAYQQQQPVIATVVGQPTYSQPAYAQPTYTQQQQATGMYASPSAPSAPYEDVNPVIRR